MHLRALLLKTILLAAAAILFLTVFLFLYWVIDLLVHPHRSGVFRSDQGLGMFSAMLEIGVAYLVARKSHRWLSRRLGLSESRSDGDKSVQQNS